MGSEPSEKGNRGTQRRALGRGIEALIRGSEQPRNDPVSSVVDIAISSIDAGPHQPRRDFRNETLMELAESIRQNGILQPVLVQKEENGRYTIIAGERRVRAAGMAGLESVPVLVRKFSDEERIEVALIENIQRQDLSPIEEANAYRSLMDGFNLSQDEVAAKVGKKRSTIANSLRLLRLPSFMQEALDLGDITSGHARAVLMVVSPSDQEVLYRRIVDQGLSVRESEAMAGELNRGSRAVDGTGGVGESIRRTRAVEITELEQRLIDTFGTKVQVRGNVERGRIEISFFSRDDLERILEIVSARE